MFIMLKQHLTTVFTDFQYNHQTCIQSHIFSPFLQLLSIGHQVQLRLESYKENKLISLFRIIILHIERHLTQ
jgi:hypothetical protein